MEAHGLWFPAEIGHVLNLDSTTRLKVGHLEIGNGLETGSWPNPTVELVGVVKRAPKLFQWDGNDDLNFHVSCKIRRQRFRKQLETGRRGLEAASNFASHFASTVPLSGSPVGGAQTPRHLPILDRNEVREPIRRQEPLGATTAAATLFPPFFSP